jgi:hypothetical protein
VKEREGWRLGTTPSSLNLVGMGSYSEGVRDQSVSRVK